MIKNINRKSKLKMFHKKWENNKIGLSNWDKSLKLMTSPKIYLKKLKNKESFHQTFYKDFKHMNAKESPETQNINFSKPMECK